MTLSSLPQTKFHKDRASISARVAILHTGSSSRAPPSCPLMLMNLTGAKQYGGNLSHPFFRCSRLLGEKIGCQLLQASYKD